MSADAAIISWKQVASRDLAGVSKVERYQRGHSERTLFVETEARNVTVAPGDRAVLTCRVQQLGAKTVRRISSDEISTFLPSNGLLRRV